MIPNKEFLTNNSKPPLMYLADDAVIIENNNLKLENRKEITKVHYIDYDGKDWGEWDIPYISGQIDSSNAFEQKYGYFEIRSKMPKSLGTWPAFWLCSKYAWPPEIDIYEIYTGKHNGKKEFESSVHWGVAGESSRGTDCVNCKTLDLTDDFHVYGCEWTESFIKFYFDGILVSVFNDKKILDKWFIYPMHIIINNGVCDYEGQNLNIAEFPNYHIVDYVKAYNVKKVLKKFAI
jgi:beta-glucanase (GH16 family)